jgi:hypothetical protein
MLRLLIGTGALLMAVGFGAAGWQYWQTLPSAAAAPVAETPLETGAEAQPARQSWLISPTGGLVPQGEVRAYLTQDRFVPERTVLVTLQARLDALLVEGEKLPEPVFLQVLADIRAPKVADGLCDALRQSIAADCAVNAAWVEDGSVDQVSGTADFRVELVYRLKDDGAEMPDLAAHVFQTDRFRLDPSAEAAEPKVMPSPEAALTEAVAAMTTACASEGVGQVCRPMRLSVDWTPGLPLSAEAEIGWLAPLPKGMIVAPPLDPASGG